MDSNRIPLTDVPAQARYIDREAIRALESTIESGRFIGGDAIGEFEETVAKFNGAKYAVACDSGSAALMAAMYACGVCGGVSIATPAMTFISIAEAAKFLSAVLVYFDIMPGSWLMQPHDSDRDSVEAAIPVALYGNHIPLGMYSNHDMVIVDAAQAHGQPFYHDFKAMTLSYFPGKVLGAFGDGGAVLTHDPVVAEIARAFVNHGRLPGEKYSHSHLGFNFRMDAFQAKILNAKYAHLQTWLDGREQVAIWYSDALAPIAFNYKIRFPVKEDSPAGHSWHLYVIQLTDEFIDRDGLAGWMKEQGIEVGVHYPIPLHRQPCYALNSTSLRVTEFLAGSALSLPIFPEMTEGQVDRVVKTLVEGIKLWA